MIFWPEASFMQKKMSIAISPSTGCCERRIDLTCALVIPAFVSTVCKRPEDPGTDADLSRDCPEFQSHAEFHKIVTAVSREGAIVCTVHETEFL